MFRGTPRLTQLVLGGNQLVTTLPDSLWSCTHLLFLYAAALDLPHSH